MRPEPTSEVPQTQEEVALDQHPEEEKPEEIVLEMQEEPVEIPETLDPAENNVAEEDPVAIVEEELIEEQPEPEAVEDEKEATAEEDRLAQLKAIVEARLKQIELERSKEKEPEIQETEPQEAVEEAASSQPETDDSEAERPASDLIDDFIRNQPSISRPQASFFNPVDAAKDSVVDDEEIVSETLAQIYFDQKHYEKAIKIYRKLSLIYPEKSSYFAAQIEKAVEELKK